MNKILPIILVVVLSACATARTLSNVNPGMSFNEVNDTMGKRDSFQVVEKNRTSVN